MTPEEIQTIFAQRPRRKNSMWELTKDNGFVNGKSPFDDASPFENKSFLKKKNPFGL